MTHLTGSSCSPRSEADRQEQIDLARWEGEGGAIARHVRRASAQPKRCHAPEKRAVSSDRDLVLSI